MVWHDLAFLHWPVSLETIGSMLPPGMELDLFEGQAWLGIVPFRMTGVRHRCLPTLPGFSSFPELNVRTYVRVGQRAGIWFFSLDAANRLAVRAARRGFYLPYFDAAMKCRTRHGRIDYFSRRTHPGAPPAEFAATYDGVGSVFNATPGSLEYFLVERYCLYAADAAGKVWRGDVHHPPWPLQLANVDIKRNTMTGINEATKSPPKLAHFSHRLEVLAWGLEVT